MNHQSLLHTYQKHLSISVRQNIKALVQPLFDSTPIQAFVYRRFYKDDSAISLSTEPKWSEDFIAKRYYEESVNPPYSGQESCVSLFDSKRNTLGSKRMFVELSEQRGLDNGIYIANKNDEYVEQIFFLASPLDENMGNFYLDNLHELKSFAEMFKRSSAKTIRDAENQKYYLPIFSSIKQLPIRQKIDMDYVAKHLRARSILSPKEQRCLHALANGFSRKQISYNMNVSEETVKSHLKNIYRKLGCDNKAKAVAAGIVQGHLSLEELL